MDTVYIHADESCLGNQNRKKARPGGAGGLLEVWADRRWERRDYWISEADTTNNRMALRSAIEPLRLLRRPCRVVFTSDSQYLVKGINEWRHAWKEKRWRKKGGPIKNLELWKRLDALVERHELSARWVRGHDGHPENEYADFLATRAATEQTGSGGLLPSDFVEWLEEERERGRYMGYMEFEPPGDRYPDYLSG
ncbi:MAG: RNase H family protein [Longimicrobiales bacterium]|nr:RNase H family protein [Longimicrobiales bacterium]